MKIIDHYPFTFFKIIKMKARAKKQADEFLFVFDNTSSVDSLDTLSDSLVNSSVKNNLYPSVN